MAATWAEYTFWMSCTILPLFILDVPQIEHTPTTVTWALPPVYNLWTGTVSKHLTLDCGQREKLWKSSVSLSMTERWKNRILPFFAFFLTKKQERPLWSARSGGHSPFHNSQVSLAYIVWQKIKKNRVFSKKRKNILDAFIPWFIC